MQQIVMPQVSSEIFFFNVTIAADVSEPLNNSEGVRLLRQVHTFCASPVVLGVEHWFRVLCVSLWKNLELQDRRHCCLGRRTATVASRRLTARWGRGGQVNPRINAVGPVLSRAAAVAAAARLERPACVSGYCGCRGICRLVALLCCARRFLKATCWISGAKCVLVCFAACWSPGVLICISSRACPDQ